MNTFSYALYNLFKQYLQPNASVHHNCLIGYWFYLLMSRPSFYLTICYSIFGFEFFSPVFLSAVHCPLSACHFHRFVLWFSGFFNRQRWSKKNVYTFPFSQRSEDYMNVLLHLGLMFCFWCAWLETSSGWIAKGSSSWWGGPTTKCPRPRSFTLILRFFVNVQRTRTLHGNNCGLLHGSNISIT